MRRITEIRHYTNLLKLVSMSAVRLKHSWIKCLSESDVLYCGKNHRMLFSSQCNNILFERCHYSNELGNLKTFSTTAMVSKNKDRGKDKKKGTQSQRVDLRELGEVIDVEKLTQELENAIDKLKMFYAKNVSLRTAAGAIEEMTITFDGSQYLLQELVQITRTPKLVTLNASAFPQVIPEIIEMLTKNQMNLNPQQDGTMIYIPIPKVTREYREDLSKSAKASFIKCRDNIKNIRMKEVKKIKDIEKLPQDVSFRVQGYIEILSNEYITKAQKILEDKQKELMGN